MGFFSALDYVTPDLCRLRTLFANLYFYKTDNNFVVIDAGLPGFSGRVLHAIERLSPRKQPDAVILTHGHFDHVGAFLKSICRKWPNVVVYAHRNEHPYLNGREAYPAPDPLADKGTMAAMSFLYPRKPIDISPRLRALPEDGSVPFMPGWRWVGTPGHTRGHISLFRESDRCLIAGDAFVTTRQESLSHVLHQSIEVNGPPSYFTPDWVSAESSIRKLLVLNPSIAATGHGKILRGAALTKALSALAYGFAQKAVPQQGRYAASYRAVKASPRQEMAKQEGAWQTLIKPRHAMPGNDFVPDPAAAPLGTDQEAGGPISTPQGFRRS